MTVRLPGMILAAGKGERMAPLTRRRAKPSLPVLGVPLVARVARELAGRGLDPLAVNAYHQPKSIQDALHGFSPRGVVPQVFPEAALMGTGGALAAPLKLLEEGPLFLVHNADTLIEVPVEALAEAACGEGRLGALLVRPGATAGYGAVLVEKGRLVGFRSPQAAPGDPFACTYLGVSAWRRELLRQVKTGGPSDLFRDLVLPLLARGWNVSAVAVDTPWLEFTSPAAYARQLFGLLRRGREKGEVALPGGPARLDVRGEATLFAAGEGVFAARARLEGTVVGEAGARVAEGAFLSDVVLLEGAGVAPGAVLRQVVVDSGLQVPRGAEYHNGVLAAAPGGTIEFHQFGDREA